MIPEPIASHQTEAVASLTQKYRNLPNTAALMRALVAWCDRIEALFWELLARFNLDDAVGVQLEALGEIVGQDREGRTDEAYRAAIRLRIHVNRSTGRPEDVIKFGDLTLAETVDYTEGAIAAFTLTLVNVDQPQEIAKLLKRVKPQGVYAVLEYWGGDPADVARWGWTGDPSLNDNTTGWSGDNTVGMPTAASIGVT
jgi:hypothetical protein